MDPREPPKPPGCRSKRCRRRTWRLAGRRGLADARLWTGVAVDEAHIYWAAYDGGESILRANLDGTGTQAFITASGDKHFFAGALAVDDLTDTKPPTTKITKAAPHRIVADKVRFEFKSSEPNSTFECKLDKRKWKSCSSPTKLKHLSPGKHKFQVRAIDAAHNVDRSPAKDEFKVPRD